MLKKIKYIVRIHINNRVIFCECIDNDLYVLLINVLLISSK